MTVRRRAVSARATRPARPAGGLLLSVLSVVALSTAGCRPATTPKEPADAAPAESAVTQGPVKLVVSFSPARLRLSDEATLRISITRDAKLTLEPGTHERTLQRAFVVSDFDEELPRIIGDDVEVTHVYRVEPLTAGELTVPPLQYRFTDPASGETLAVETLPVQAEVTTMIEGVPELSDLSPTVDPMDLPRDPWRYVYLIGSGAGLAVILLYLFLRNRQGPPPPPPLTPAEVARRDLDALRTSGIAETDVKEFYVLLTGIVRRYVEGTTGIRAPEQTTDEFLRETEQQDLFSNEEQLRFREFLEAADLVKYAAHSPTHEDIVFSLNSAEAFVAWQPPDAEDASDSAEEPAS